MLYIKILGREVNVENHIISVSCEKNDNPELVCVNILKYMFWEGLLSSPIKNYKVRAVEYT